MKQPLNFRLEAGTLIEVSTEEAEKLLLQALEDAQDNSTKALWQLAQFYKLNRQHEKALDRLRQLLSRLPDLEDKAECVFTMGQAMEQVGDYPAAIQYYREAYAFEPTSSFTWYFINNNLGYSLNRLGDFVAGERYCRQAIGVDASRPNGHKNLGLALAGQGRIREAGQAYVRATRANAADGRALDLLEKLIEQHPELEFEFQEELQACRQAVEVVARKADGIRPTVHRGWRKQAILLRMKLQAWWRRVCAGCAGTQP